MNLDYFAYCILTLAAIFIVLPTVGKSINDRVGYWQSLAFGRLTVMGRIPNMKARWSCRCDCGYYVIRTNKAIRNPENKFDRCDHCRHSLFIKREQIYLKTGKDVDISELG